MVLDLSPIKILKEDMKRVDILSKEPMDQWGKKEPRWSVIKRALDELENETG